MTMSGPEAHILVCQGSLITTASWMRRFIRSHPDYKFDSVVSDGINYDLLKAVDEMCVDGCWSHDTPIYPCDNFSERGVRMAPELLPDGWCARTESDRLYFEKDKTIDGVDVSDLC